MVSASTLIGPFEFDRALATRPLLTHVFGVKFISSHNKRRFTGELRNCFHLVSIHDIGLKLTFNSQGTVSREFDEYSLFA